MQKLLYSALLLILHCFDASSQLPITKFERDSAKNDDYITFSHQDVFSEKPKLYSFTVKPHDKVSFELYSRTSPVGMNISFITSTTPVRYFNGSQLVQRDNHYKLSFDTVFPLRGEVAIAVYPPKNNKADAYTLTAEITPRMISYQEAVAIYKEKSILTYRLKKNKKESRLMVFVHKLADPLEDKDHLIITWSIPEQSLKGTISIPVNELNAYNLDHQFTAEDKVLDKTTSIFASLNLFSIITRTRTGMKLWQPLGIDGQKEDFIVKNKAKAFRYLKDDQPAIMKSTVLENEKGNRKLVIGNTEAVILFLSTSEYSLELVSIKY